MPNLPQKKLTKADVAAVLLLTALSLTLFFGLRNPVTPDAVFTVTTPAGSASYPLAQNAVISVESEGFTLTVTAEGGAVSVSEADCPDQVCKATGRITRPGQSIVCVPAQVVIRIESPGNAGEGGDGNADFILG